MSDFFVKCAVEIAFKLALWALERIGTTDFAQDVVHSIEKRLERSGIPAALNAAFKALPFALQSRIAAGPRPVFTATVDGLAALSPLVVYFMISYAGYRLTTNALGFVMTTIQLHVPWHFVAHVIAAPLFIFAAIIIARSAYTIAMWLIDYKRIAPMLFLMVCIATIVIGFFSPVIQTYTVVQSIALNAVFPAMLACALLVVTQNSMTKPRRDRKIEAHLKCHYGDVLKQRLQREMEFRKRFVFMK